MKKKLFVFSYMMTAFPLILAGMDALDQGNAVFGTVYLLCGLVYMSIGYLVFKKEVSDNKWISVFGVVILLIVAYDYYIQGKKYLPYAYLAASVLSLIPLLVKKMKEQKKTE